MEFNTDRFSISGSIQSYDNLQSLKNEFKQMDIFKNKKIIESNRKNKEEIIFRISIDLKN